LAELRSLCSDAARCFADGDPLEPESEPPPPPLEVEPEPPDGCEPDPPPPPPPPLPPPKFGTGTLGSWVEGSDGVWTLPPLPPPPLLPPDGADGVFVLGSWTCGSDGTCTGAFGSCGTSTWGRVCAAATPDSARQERVTPIPVAAPPASARITAG
jgi:hypothetical protein